jgi:DNA-binding NarL/FixJ family response regulator
MYSDPGRLTARERDILECLTRGLTTPQIARELYLAQGTVKAHLGSIYRKLGVSNRTEAALKAVQQDPRVPWRVSAGGPR